MILARASRRRCSQDNILFPDGSYKLLKMPFRIVNSGATMMRSMRILLEGIENVEHVVADILIHNVFWEGQLGTFQELLRRMSAANLTSRTSKTVIGVHVIDFVGYRVRHGVTSPLEENLRKIRDVQRPRTKKEIRLFLGSRVSTRITLQITRLYRHH